MNGIFFCNELGEMNERLNDGWQFVTPHDLFFEMKIIENSHKEN